MIKVAITDDQAIVRYGVSRILENEPDITISGVYAGGESLLTGIAQTLPDVVLLDIQMPGKNGVELAGIITKLYPTIHIIALTNNDSPEQARDMLKQGCLGYLLKDTEPRILIEAIKAVNKGDQYIYDDLKKQLLSMLSQTQDNVITRREKEILHYIVDGLTNQQIANQLFLSLRTVENHRNRLLQKLGVKNTAALVKLAMQKKLV
ncbi:two component transcriptional regulator, LuxR family [Filimonas lacunae]|uniref:Two component transcriptional regulator, LuxR family n=1 Tax=Filimonas lacunae TaxID=477680 RepID=A0A173MM53_9BACT|nr:response regulator transcription factor [Filimonas lacunae]BAV08566.1 two-component transcriptional regulator, LuxR family [Filimonas lacunae]SIS57259.1 two component transcriptional regulator, LuxR family [Filimonas lacunae]